MSPHEEKPAPTMAELAAQQTINLEQMIKAVERELRFRAQVYPRMVRSGKMSELQRIYEVKCMGAVLAHLKAGLPQQQSLIVTDAANG